MAFPMFPNFHLLYLRSFSWTLGSEVVIAYILGLRKWREIKAILLCSLISHPILTTIMMDRYYRGLALNTVIFPYEVCVVIFEWIIMMKLIKKNPIYLLIVSATMNAGSYFGGYWLFA